MFSKIKALPKKVKVMLTTVMMLCMGSAVALADETGNMSFGTTQLQSILTSITSVISVSDIITLLGAIIAVAGVFVLMWWGIRKGMSWVMGAVRSGRLGGK